MMLQPSSKQLLGIVRRALAFVIDYLIVSVLSLGTLSLVPDSDLYFLGVLTVSALYFTIGNSALTGGRTLGKRLFGLAVVDRDQNALSLIHSFIRYLCGYGAIILAAEIPPYLFRQYGVQLPTWLPDPNLILAFGITFTNVLLISLPGRHRGLHDLAVGSSVVLTGFGSERDPTQSFPIEMPRLELWAPVVGFVLAWFLRFNSVAGDQALAEIHAGRYMVEQRFPLRIESIGRSEGKVLIRGYWDRSLSATGNNQNGTGLDQENQVEAANALAALIRDRLAPTTLVLRLTDVDLAREKMANLAKQQAAGAAGSSADQTGIVNDLTVKVGE
jgi:uncharacterized RDD family membrane protein YckC